MEQRTEQAINKLIDEGLFFSVNKSMLARHFLNDVLEINVFQLNIEEVSKEICGKFDYELEELPDEKEELYQFVAENIMRIKANQEPYQAFNHEVFLVMEDLRKINSMIQEYQSKQEDKDIDRYEKKKYEYLVVKLYKAKDEICEYMTGEIKSCVYKEIKDWSQIIDFSHSGSFNQMLPVRYSFRDREEEYEMSVFAGLNYKFKFLGTWEQLELKRLHSNNKIEEFNARVDGHISTHEIDNKILSLIEENHVLNKRGMLKQAIEVYKEGRMELFCQIIPLQIEGIIYDYCIELGVSLSSIERTSLDKKVEEIVKRDRWFKCHEYFKYDFIELRNTAAHGRLHENVNFKDTANMLILDLMYLCESLNSSNALVVNKMRKLIKRFEENINNEYAPVGSIVYEFIEKYRDKSLPLFYGKENVVEEIEKYAKSKKIIDYIYVYIMHPFVVSALSAEQKQEIVKVIVYLMRSKEIKEQCVNLLQLLAANSKEELVHE
ncbi:MULTISPECIES: hypothetical protein [Bacillus cereus group]|uniref:Uncharacterized protein n=1 Tax=Bacillus cereus HuA2-1 TaxID=1053201 RepID=J9BKJ7_BACCE|nr:MULTISPECIES: hypothetical protein [Bacillus cereus group]EJV74082.1 hypothetical protein IG3_05904 [Bacillus cereus HuA2-1]QWI47021.1 hypothetical protein EXW55_29550 [Bacillus mycoides]